jgi:hypothetical protein
VLTLARGIQCDLRRWLPQERILVMQPLSGYVCKPFSVVLPERTLQYEALVDKQARRHNVAAQLHPHTFYGQVQHFYMIRFREPCPDLGETKPTVVIMASIQSCVIDKTKTVPGMDFHFYKKTRQDGRSRCHLHSVSCRPCKGQGTFHYHR